MATELIKVYTPIKRVPIMIGKAQNGQKLPFGPYTLPQIISGVVVILIASVLAMALPINPAVTFLIGVALTVAVVFGIGLIPYTGVRLTSRVMWVGRLILIRKPVSASGIPVTPDSARHTMYVEESIVVILPDRRADAVEPPPPRTRVLPGNVLDRWSRTLAKVSDNDSVPAGERG
ncbi:hypothetical protein [Nocardia aobensis]|uniref:hypothetical protein n=1 Tax=Nocardia aobensis TaxID=257277 RepID=UPI00031E04F9|nr:hypothetical protein [Nocardia aobensis]